MGPASPMSSPEIELAGELTAEQTEAVLAYVAAMGQMADAMDGLVQVGLDAGTALKAIRNPDGDGTMFDALPMSARMMLG